MIPANGAEWLVLDKLEIGSARAVGHIDDDFVDYIWILWRGAKVYLCLQIRVYHRKMSGLELKTGS